MEQRGALEAKATRGAPHVLLMTATPIPRTLGQVLYADLDVSTLRTPPAGRVPIRTGIRRPDDLDGTWQRVREEAAHIAVRSVIDVHSTTLGLDQPGPPELVQVVTDRGLGQPQHHGEVAAVFLPG